MGRQVIREYVWLDWDPVAVIEGGVVYYVGVDHIGRPAFATDATGAVVWSASYLPFGEVRVSTGPLPPMRFPGQWFQAESGLHQNWMRDYDPTTGRYLQADPLGLVDGASVYGYARQNPGRWTDPRGEQVGVLDGGGWGTTTGGALGGLGSAGAAAGLAALAVILTPTPIGDGTLQPQQCTSSCPPCKSTLSGNTILIGSLGYRYEPKSRGHYPFTTGQHVHLYEAHQNPMNCRCFWHNLKKVVAPPPPNGAYDIKQNPF